MLRQLPDIEAQMAGLLRAIQLPKRRAQFGFRRIGVKEIAALDIAIAKAVGQRD